MSDKYQPRPPTIIRLPLDGAIASILGRKEHRGYRNIGQNMKIASLYKLLGLKGSPMLYHYMSGKTVKIEPERALVILDRFDVLVDEWATREELLADISSVELSKQIAREPIREIVEELVEIETLTTLPEITRAMRVLIAKYY